MKNEMEEPQILYHYCSLEAFYGIIKSKSLWLSDAKSSNDAMEGELTTLMLDKLIENTPSIKGSALYPDFIKNYKLNGSIMAFITCFAKNGDRLSQWRGYANDGHGVAIGFNAKTFGIRNHLPHATSKFEDKSIGLQKVIYDEETQLERLREIVGDRLDELDQITKVLPLTTTRYLFKNPAFFEEEEWRILHLSYPNKNDNYKLIGAMDNLMFRQKQNDIVPYFNLPLKENSIVEIVLGPKNTMNKTKIKAFLSSNGFQNVEISYSKASYR